MEEYVKQRQMGLSQQNSCDPTCRHGQVGSKCRFRAGCLNKLTFTVLNRIIGIIMTFKSHLDNFMDRKGLEGYGPGAEQWD